MTETPQTPAAEAQPLGQTRLYHRDEEGVLSFREAWYEPEEGVIVVNRGTVGFISKEHVQPVASEDEARELLEAFAAQSAEDGYAEIPREEQTWVVAQFALKTKDGTARDAYLKENALNEIVPYFAWRGLGVVDHDTLQNGKLNFFLLSPEPAKAVKALITVTREADLDPTKLSIGVAPYAEPTALKRRHPAKGGPFTL